MIYAKLAAALALLGAFAWGTIADYHAGKKAGQDATQEAWDKDKAAIQAVADAAIATATKERDAALEANGVISAQYQTQLSAANANAAQFAQRLRNAEAAIAAGGSSSGKAGSGSAPATAGQASSAVQLGRLLTLITDFHTECQANADQLDALIAEIRPQL